MKKLVAGFTSETASVIRRVLLPLMLMSLAGFSTFAEAKVLCVDLLGIVTVRDKCILHEIQLDPASVGLVGPAGAQGPAGPQGPQGVQGPAGPTNVFGLTVSKTGTGTGQVTSSDTGIVCDPDCTEVYPAGTQVTLTATPASGSTFIGWSGDCSNTGPCTLTLSAMRTVTAQFDVSGGGGAGCSAPITHSNGLGQTFTDCVPLATYNLTQAREAAQALLDAMGGGVVVSEQFCNNAAYFDPLLQAEALVVTGIGFTAGWTYTGAGVTGRAFMSPVVQDSAGVCYALGHQISAPNWN